MVKKKYLWDKLDFRADILVEWTLRSREVDAHPKLGTKMRRVYKVKERDGQGKKVSHPRLENGWDYEKKKKG